MVKDILRKQFDTCYDENSWFVAVRNALDGVPAEEAVWKPAGADNSIWQTVAHLSYYNGAYLLRFKGIDYEYDTADNDATFRGGDADDARWKAELERFDATMTEWRELPKAADESKFDQAVPQKAERKWWELLADINAHNAYHGGQILLVRKLHGTWDREKGVS